MGSGWTFEPSGEHELVGVPGKWALYALAIHDETGTPPTRVD
jgi:hypothetical protein